MNLELLPKIQPNLVWRVLSNETVVVSPASGQYCVLNEMGTVIWQLVADSCSVPEIEAYLIENYEVSSEQAQADIGRFIADLQQRGLLTLGG